MIDFNKRSLELHKKLGGKLEITLKTSIDNKNDLSTIYSPGVAAPCLEIKKNPDIAKELVFSKKAVAVISDGSAVLGLGNIGALASLPVMEGKSALFKRFANIDSIPLVVQTQDVEEFINVVKNVSPTFGGINLEDISAPRCFEIEERLKKELDIPVFHDDQHGTAIVVLAGLINSLKITGRKKEDVKIITNGVGAAGVAIIKLLLKYGFKNIVACDSKGAICADRNDLNEIKKMVLKMTNTKPMCGDLKELIKGRDVFIGVSVANLVSEDMVKSMNKDSIIFGLANPIPEILPENAKRAGAKIIATGRSDFPNQINNVLVFPAIFKTVFMKNIPQITDEHKIQAAVALAGVVKNPGVNEIIPSPFNENVVDAIMNGIKK